MRMKEKKEDDMEGDPAGTGTLGKAMAVLEAVAMADRPQRFTDILQIVRQPRGTLHRLLGHLVEEGLLVQRRDLSYEPGLRLLKFAYRSWSGNRFREIAAPYLLHLHQLTGETVHLGLLREAEIIYVDKVESRQTVRMSSQIGKASPAYCTGIGKAALSVLPGGELQRISTGMEFHPFTAQTHRSIESLLAEIEEIRHDGHAFDREEHEAEICCVAAPISVPEHDLVGGISVTGPSYRVSLKQLTAWAQDVRKVAAEIEEEVRIRLGPGRETGAAAPRVLSDAQRSS
ncbi:IclR family transcriptional regulator [Sinorhizobium meliloti]|uniref:IclR family transcriptional regulator n=1 Tax=Rhizobium meliloti TaxID=382 RepID=UPI00059B2F60|nr:IclR family transcriptional regulator [Sinorhizobium meliloti]KKA13907.1 IclR family transcriptional regulator [Sinorhizobium meliloti]UIJ96608.1 IclR family transcriptional regulator [Sinorhizobium meliloti]WKL27423.1 IclR family transcriptional regulator [Sinorhizobium meliloti]WKL33024.1 IclR family transcriptional regulator [Sinorhizobium meliloti]WKL38793.1 IclR family transcriptional regulator [Sinorhizobium meliloti]